MTTPRAARLAATPLPDGGSGPRHLVLLHGIYGRGRNWQPIARRIAAARTEYTCWLVDLRHHGDSAREGGPDTLDGLAADVEAWARDAGIDVTATLGHSYGGKVALAYARRQRERPLQTWVIDSTPEAKPPGGSAWDMLQVVRALPDTFATRAEAVEGVEAGGFSTGVAQWMSTNLERRDDGRYRWALDFTVMERLLQDFFVTDLWDVVEPPAPGHDVHVVKATRSSVISADATERLARLAAARSDVHLHQLEGGHWIHAEAPDAVAALLVDGLR